MKTKTKDLVMAVVAFFFWLALIIISVIQLTSCSPPAKEPVHRKPFYVNEKTGSYGKDYCQYHFIDADGNEFTITELCSKYSIGDSIK